MPIVTVDIIGEPGPSETKLAQELADACAPAFPPEHREVWLQVRFTPGRDWAVSGGPASERPAPILVHVVREVNPQGKDLEREIRGITAAVARVAARPAENVHVTYEPSALGRMAFGGKLLHE